MKSIKSIIKENIEYIWVYTIIGGLGFVGMISYDPVGDNRRKFNHDPIKVEYLQLNPDYDSIEDRVLSNSEGTLRQEQFGYVNPKTGATEYLTLDQITKMLKEEVGKNVESELKKYKKEGE